jgi:hypothetical protein
VTSLEVGARFGCLGAVADPRFGAVATLGYRAHGVGGIGHFRRLTSGLT